ncbi:MAG: hypothetical protein U1F65_04670 [Verrucomicrobiota bacterium]
MEHKITSLINTLKNVDAFGTKYRADFPPASAGGQQFAVVHHTLTHIATRCDASDREQIHGGVLAHAACRWHLHDDLIAISNAAHSIMLLGNPAIGGKFVMPRSNSDQALLKAARNFAEDAPVFASQFVALGLPANFIRQLTLDTVLFDGALAEEDHLAETAHKATIALHVLDTIVKNAYKNDAKRLAEWSMASHREKPVPVKKKRAKASVK